MTYGREYRLEQLYLRAFAEAMRDGARIAAREFAEMIRANDPGAGDLADALLGRVDAIEATLAAADLRHIHQLQDAAAAECAPDADPNLVWGEGTPHEITLGEIRARQAAAAASRVGDHAAASPSQR